MPLILGTNSIKDTGYNVANSLRFDGGSTDNLSRTFTAGNRKTFTISVWVKRANLSTEFQAVNVAHTGEQGIFFAGGDQLDLYFLSGRRKTNAVYRDVSTWYHIVVAVDSTNSTADDRIKLYVNGVQETSFGTSTNPSLNAEGLYNDNGNTNNIGKHSSQDYDFYGYQAEHCFIDGQALDPTSFGEFDSDSPTIWNPKDVSGLTFGTNGFHLDFENASSLGADVSGNGNNFTVSNLTSIDHTTDTCTNNFATFNPLMSLSTGNSFPTALTDGNTINSDTRSGGDARSLATIAVPRTGKWYYECKVISGGAYISIGLFQYLGNAVPTKWVRYYGASGIKNLDGTSTSYGATFTNNDIIGCLADIENNQITFYKNGASQGAISYTFASGEDYFMTAGDEAGTSHSVAANFGNPAFTISSGNSDPAGYGNFEYSTDGGYALNTKNLAEFG